MMRHTKLMFTLPGDPGSRLHELRETAGARQPEQGCPRFQGRATTKTAINYFQEAIRLDPELTNAELYLATAYAQQFIPGRHVRRKSKDAPTWRSRRSTRSSQRDPEQRQRRRGPGQHLPEHDAKFRSRASTT